MASKLHISDGGSIADTSDNEILVFGDVVSAVNEIKITNAATTNGPIIAAQGSDTNINLNLQAKGTGVVKFTTNSSRTLALDFDASSADADTIFTISSTADRNITFPDLTDTLVGRATTDTLTNKTLTSAVLTSAVLTTPQINDSSSDHQYVFAVSELAADRTVTLPLLISNDEFTFKDHIQTLTNKTLTNPTINNASLSGTLSGTPTFSGVGTHSALDIFNAGITVKNGSTSAGFIEFFENSGNGTNKVTLIGPASSGDVTVTLPASTDTLVGKATTDTLTNKTLTNPTINAAALSGTLSGTPTFSGVGTHSALDIFNAGITVKNGSTSAGFIEFFENSGNGTNKVTLIGPASTSDLTLTLPSADGSNGQVLTTNGSGVLSFSSASGVSVLGGLTDVKMDVTNFLDSLLIQTNSNGGAPTTGSLDAASDNIGIGKNVFLTLQSGDNNVGIGSTSLDALTSGSNNVGIGSTSLTELTTGGNNTCLGYGSGRLATTMSSAVIIGYSAGASAMDTNANGTVAIGTSACNALTTGVGNTAVGFEALKTNVDGDYNTAFGYQALETFEANADGDGKNTAIGYNAGQAISTGTGNTIIGAEAGDALVGGNDNTFLGEGAGGSTTDGGSLVIIGKGAGAAAMTTDANGTVAIGASAGAAITSGQWNTAIGYQALMTEDTMNGSVAIGYQSLKAQNGIAESETGANTAIGYLAGTGLVTGVNNTIMGAAACEESSTVSDTVIIGFGAGGNMNTDCNGTVAIGYQAATALSEGIGNTAVGYQALMTEDAHGDHNTAIGYKALTTMSADTNTHGQNTAVGFEAGKVISVGIKNTCIGASSGDEITTADDNTCVGYNAGALLTTAIQNTFIGSLAGQNLTVGDTGDSNKGNNTCIGYNSQTSGATAKNEVTLGDSNITALRCADTTIASLSDERDKTNIVDSDYGLDFVNNLRPVQFTWQRRNLVSGDSESVLNGKTRVGFIAQELQNAMPNNENDILDLVYDVNPERIEAKYGNLIPILTKAIQDLSAANEALVARVAALENA